MQRVCLQLESPLATLAAVRQRQARVLPPHEPHVVAAAVRAPVLRALVSPNMPLDSLLLFGFNTFLSRSHSLTASSPGLLHPPAQSTQHEPQSQQPQAARANQEVQMNAQGGEILNDEDLNRDWLDWVYTVSRAVVLLSIVYFYSSFSRFVMVMMAMLVLYL